MCEKRMDGMSAFMHHGSHIMHLSGSIHKYKRSATFGQWAVISARSFSLPAFQVQVTQLFHLAKTVSKKGTELFKAVHCFFSQIFTRCKRFQRFHSFRFSFRIPGTQYI